MATTWECPDTAVVGQVQDRASNWYPTCSEPMLLVESIPPFDVAQIDPSTATGAAGAGFIVLGSGLLIVKAVRLIIDTVKGI